MSEWERQARKKLEEQAQGYCNSYVKDLPLTLDEKSEIVQKCITNWSQLKPEKRVEIQKECSLESGEVEGVRKCIGFKILNPAKGPTIPSDDQAVKCEVGALHAPDAETEQGFRAWCYADIPKSELSPTWTSFSEEEIARFSLPKRLSPKEIAELGEEHLLDVSNYDAIDVLFAVFDANMGTVGDHKHTHEEQVRRRFEGMESRSKSKKRFKVGLKTLVSLGLITPHPRYRQEWSLTAAGRIATLKFMEQGVDPFDPIWRKATQAEREMAISPKGAIVSEPEGSGNLPPITELERAARVKEKKAPIPFAKVKRKAELRRRIEELLRGGLSVVEVAQNLRRPLSEVDRIRTESNIPHPERAKEEVKIRAKRHVKLTPKEGVLPRQLSESEKILFIEGIRLIPVKKREVLLILLKYEGGVEEPLIEITPKQQDEINIDLALGRLSLNQLHEYFPALNKAKLNLLYTAIVMTFDKKGMFFAPVRLRTLAEEITPDELIILETLSESPQKHATIEYLGRFVSVPLKTGLSKGDLPHLLENLIERGLVKKVIAQRTSGPFQKEMVERFFLTRLGRELLQKQIIIDIPEGSPLYMYIHGLIKQGVSTKGILEILRANGLRTSKAYIERVMEWVGSGKFRTPMEIKRKYRIAQAFLERSTLPKIEESDPTRVRNYFIALMQSIAAAQEFEIPISAITKVSVERFLNFILDAVRDVAIVHIYWLSFWEAATQSVAQKGEEAKAFVRASKIRGSFVSPSLEQMLRTRWDDWARILGEADFYDVFWQSVMGDEKIKQQWIELEQTIRQFLRSGYWIVEKEDVYGSRKFREDSLVVLFEKIRDTAHHGGFLLREYILPTEEEASKVRNFFLKKRWIKPSQFVNVYQMFMDRLSKNAFEFELPYEFGVFYAPGVTEKNKYVIAQEFLRGRHFPSGSHYHHWFEWDEVNRKDFFFFFIGITQSIAYEQEAEIPYSEVTLNAVKHFTTIFLRLIRYRLLDIIDMSLSWRCIWDVLKEEASPEVRRELDDAWDSWELSSASQTVTILPNIIARKWDFLYGLMGEKFEECMYECLRMVSDQFQWIWTSTPFPIWMKLVNMLGAVVRDDFRNISTTRLVILFESIRSIEHQNGIIIADYMILPASVRDSIIGDQMTSELRDAIWAEIPKTYPTFSVALSKLYNDFSEGFNILRETEYLPTIHPLYINLLSGLAEQSYSHEVTRFDVIDCIMDASEDIENIIKSSIFRFVLAKLDENAFQFDLPYDFGLFKTPTKVRQINVIIDASFFINIELDQFNAQHVQALCKIFTTVGVTPTVLKEIRERAKYLDAVKCFQKLTLGPEEMILSRKLHRLYVNWRQEVLNDPKPKHLGEMEMLAVARTRERSALTRVKGVAVIDEKAMEFFLQYIQRIIRSLIEGRSDKYSKVAEIHGLSVGDLDGFQKVKIHKSDYILGLCGSRCLECINSGLQEDAKSLLYSFQMLLKIIPHFRRENRDYFLNRFVELIFAYTDRFGGSLNR